MKFFAAFFLGVLVSTLVAAGPLPDEHGSQGAGQGIGHPGHAGIGGQYDSFGGSGKENVAAAESTNIYSLGAPPESRDGQTALGQGANAGLGIHGNHGFPAHGGQPNIQRTQEHRSQAHDAGHDIYTN